MYSKNEAQLTAAPRFFHMLHFLDIDNIYYGTI